MNTAVLPIARDGPALLAAWDRARTEGVNNRAAALKLGVSEAQLLATACGKFATRLRLDLRALLAELPQLGEIKAVVRNPFAVLERAGAVREVGLDPSGGAGVHAETFELRCELSAWRSGFALEEQSARGVKLSLQFFTAAGVSAAKFFVRPSGDVAAFRSLVRRFADLDQSIDERIAAELPPAVIWLDPLVRVGGDALLRFLETGRGRSLPLTFLVRSPAAALSATKVLERVKRSDRGGWVNVLDHGLDVHLHEARLQYLRAHQDPDADAGWFHWFSEQRAVALSVRCSDGWMQLAQACVPARAEAGS